MSAKRRPPSPQPRRRQVAGIRRPGAPSPSPRPSPSPKTSETSEEPAASTQAEPDTSASTVDTEGAGEAHAGTKPPKTPAEPSSDNEPSDNEPSDVEPSSDDESGAEADAEADDKPEAKPKPRAKSRTRGVAKPTADRDTADESAAESESKEDQTPKRSSARTGTIVTAVIGVVLTVAAVVFGIAYGNVKAGMANKSMSDPMATQQVKGQVEDAVTKVFSYRWNELDAHQKDVDGVLAPDGQVRKQYDMLFPDVKSKAPKQKLTVTTKVTYSSVLNLTDDEASLLVYLEQSSWRGNDKKNKSAGGGFLKVDAKLVDDKWRIANFDIYKPIKAAPSTGAQAPNGAAQAPKSSKKAPSSSKTPPTSTKKGN